jgi:hypothetical protein
VTDNPNKCYNRFLLVVLHGLRISLKKEYTSSIFENEVLKILKRGYIRDGKMLLKCTLGK